MDFPWFPLHYYWRIISSSGDPLFGNTIASWNLPMAIPACMDVYGASNAALASRVGVALGSLMRLMD
jgi:hypothetical protein